MIRDDCPGSLNTDPDFIYPGEGGRERRSRILDLDPDSGAKKAYTGSESTTVITGVFINYTGAGLLARTLPD
jgi:hypothetical protein